MLNVGKYFNNITNKNNSGNIKDGDIVRYSVMRKLDSDRALINIMGNKVTALFKNGMTEKGFALVGRKNGEITLTLLKDASSLKEARENLKNIGTKKDILVNITRDNSEISNILLEKGIKPSHENIRYLETILKYLPDLDINKKKFILNAMSNGVYLTVEEINSLGNIFRHFNDILSIIKNSNKNTETTEILLMLLNTAALNSNNNLAENLDKYIHANANFNAWFMLFDMLQGELSSDSSNMLMLVLKILSSNRKNRNFKETVFMLPIPFIINGEVKELLLYINKEESEMKNKLSFVFYDDDKELCEIKISEYETNKYLFDIQLFDKKLYNKVDREEIMNLIKDFENIKIEINLQGNNNEK
ncbi:hypothetical protein Q5M87_10725 [Brachyspira innocens]|uniref:Flagellar hook-length control protein FliK n=1 Tax=Brachyspira innocens TaxID=13264 RepID=A0ABT8YYN8_9SPIR|nr:hypothetical protein [Brachyspira innocens]MDO6994480.1 hypothetical protein [Brachyspira innocens]MDO7020665.1 hypothetical protein [Brachyspira innocens]